MNMLNDRARLWISKALQRVRAMCGLGIVTYPQSYRCLLTTVHHVLQLLNLYILYLNTHTERMVMHVRGTSPKHTSTATSSPRYRSIKSVTKKQLHSFPFGRVSIIIVIFSTIRSKVE